MIKVDLDNGTHLRVLAHVPTSATVQVDVAPVFRSQEVINAQCLQVFGRAFTGYDRSRSHHLISLCPVIHDENRLVAHPQCQLAQSRQDQDCREVVDLFDH